MTHRVKIVAELTDFYNENSDPTVGVDKEDLEAILYEHFGLVIRDVKDYITISILPKDVEG